MSDAGLLFSPLEMKGLSLENRITMTPLFLSYAGPDGAVTPLLLDHYREMGASGAAMIVVECAIVNPLGLGSPFMLRVDDARYLEGLSALARAIQQGGARAVLQINHAGRYAFGPDRVAPSAFPTGDVVPREMTHAEIEQTIRDFAAGAARVQAAGFEAVDLHGGTGYLLAQFLSPRTNQRTDEWGGSLRGRMRFPLRVVEAVREAVGDSYPIGYRLLATDCVPGGLELDESTQFAQELERRGVAYLSVMAGIHDAYHLPEYVAREKHQGYMVDEAAAIKRAVSHTPVIAAGRLQTPEFAEQMLAEKRADLVGLARVLFADPLWPKKAAGQVAEPIAACNPSCSLCLHRIMQGKPAYCAQWSAARRQAFLKKTGEAASEAADG